jgi:hypothetical protein
LVDGKSEFERGLNRMLTEREITLRWRELLRSPSFDEGVCAKASELIDLLPATSPLRQRYAGELSDLRRVHLPQELAKPKATTRRKVK